MMTAIILAAGSGKRMGTSIPKQYLTIDGIPILARTIQVFQDSEEIDEILLVTASDYVDYCQEEIVEAYHLTKVREIVIGGKERYDSVRNALQHCPNADYVMIQDGARPYVTKDILSRTAACVKQYKTAVVGMPSKDTVKIVDDEGYVVSTPDRAHVWNIQTPQAFAYDLILAANDIVAKQGMEGITDDAMIVEASGLAKVRLVEGTYENIKITTPDDLH